MKAWKLALVLAACNAPPPPQNLPWVRGMTVTAEAAEAGYGSVSVPASFGTVTASYEHGLTVLDGSEHAIARAPGFAFEGSADDLVAIAVGDAQLEQPVIALAVTHGGHRESTTTLVLYQLGDHGQLDQIFAAPIEEHEGERTTAGSLAFVPRGLVYRSPSGRLESWTFDAASHRYIKP